jgi:hypothetical protein
MAMCARRVCGRPAACAWRAALRAHASHAYRSGGAFADRLHAHAPTCSGRNGPRGRGLGHRGRASQRRGGSYRTCGSDESAVGRVGNGSGTRLGQRDGNRTGISMRLGG